MEWRDREDEARAVLAFLCLDAAGTDSAGCGAGAVSGAFSALRGCGAGAVGRSWTGMPPRTGWPASLEARVLSLIRVSSIRNLGFMLARYDDSHCTVIFMASYMNGSGHLPACSLYLFFSESGRSRRASRPEVLLTRRSLKWELSADTKCRALKPLDNISSNFRNAVL